MQRYSFALAERLGRRQRELIHEMDVTELLEWMPYDLSQDEEFIKKHKLEQQRAASADEQYKQFKAFFQGK